MSPGNIYLIPSPISGKNPELILSPVGKDIISRMDIFFVENIRTTRRFFSAIGIQKIEKIRFEILNKDTSSEEFSRMIEMVSKGKSAGIVSEAGCPGIADPGSEFILAAHQAKIRIIPLPGPSSILMALMASGFSGQRFVFHGYLPIDKKARKNRIRAMEIQSRNTDETQIFMETPYRNRQLMGDLLEYLRNSTFLCIASDITGNEEFIKTKSIRDWKKSIPDLHKKPTIFLISST
jgi:16S rRNA (cytidine1402-2'-O)-methyltransferase